MSQIKLYLLRSVISILPSRCLVIFFEGKLDRAKFIGAKHLKPHAKLE